MGRYYCSVNELIEDIGQLGVPDSQVLEKIKAASQFVDETLGHFLPILETRKLQAVAGHPTELLVQPLVKVISLVNDGVTLASTDYVLRPDARHWSNGPYTSIEIAQDGSASAWTQDQNGIVLTCWDGLWDESVSLGISVSQLLTDTTLVVTDGSLISAGMVLLLESEWELVTSTGAATASTATLNGALDDSAEEITVSDGTKVKTGELIKVDFELMRVLDISGNVVLAARGVNGSKRVSHLSGVAVNVFRTFNVSRGVNGSTAAAHTSAAVSRQIPPADVNYLARQIAALMIKKAQTGYVGRSGNDELGTGFFVNEFPRNQIEAVKKNYFWGGV